MRVLCGGAAIEDVDYFSRRHELFHDLTTADYRSDMDIQGLDSRVDKTIEQPTPANRPGIARGTRKYVSFKPLSGLFNQDAPPAQVLPAGE